MYIELEASIAKDNVMDKMLEGASSAAPAG